MGHVNTKKRKMRYVDLFCWAKEVVQDGRQLRRRGGIGRDMTGAD